MRFVVLLGAVAILNPCAAAPYRVLISTDLGGDPDDIQSLYRLLHYSDVLSIEGIVSSPGPGAKHSAELVRERIKKVEVERMRKNGHRELMAEAQLLTLRGIYSSGDQSGKWNWIEFVNQTIRPQGVPGEAFPLAGPQRASLKYGDSPSILYLLSIAVGRTGKVDDPTQENWSGRFRHADRVKYPNYYVDLETKAEAQESISKWRAQFLSDWERRWARYGPARTGSQ